MSKLNLAPLTSIKVTKEQIPSYNLLPNTSIQQYPLLIYHSCFPSFDSPLALEKHLKEVGVVVPAWRYTMYSTTHFHSTTHEVLCVCSGSAKLCFGGEENPDRFEAVVRKGDAIVIPAGVGHRLLEDLDGGFEMIGSYPDGRSWDMCYGKSGEEEKIGAIKSVSWFKKDPLYGTTGPALEV